MSHGNYFGSTPPESAVITDAARPATTSKWRDRRWFLAGAATTLVVVGVIGWFQATAADRELMQRCVEEVRASEPTIGPLLEFNGVQVFEANDQAMVSGLVSGLATPGAEGLPKPTETQSAMFLCQMDGNGEMAGISFAYTY